MATRFWMKSNQCWYIKYKDVDGKWKSVSCGKHANADDAEVIRKTYDAKELNLRHKTTVRLVKADLIEQLEYYKKHEIPRSNTGRPKGRKSIIRYQAIIKNFVIWLQDHDIKLYKSVNERYMKLFFDSLYQLNRSASTIEKYKQLLNNFWVWSINNGYTTENPTTVIKRPKRTTKIPRFFSEEELKTIFAAAVDQYRNIYQFLFLTGIRIGELGNLEWTDYLQQVHQIKLRVIEGNKTKREEVVPLNPDAVAIIEKQKSWRDKLNTADSHRYIFTNGLGNKLDNANIYENLKRILNNNNILDASPHTFRHTCASHLAIKGVSIYVIKDILRHASVEESSIYAHLSGDAIRDAITLLKL